MARKGYDQGVRSPRRSIESAFVRRRLQIVSILTWINDLILCSSQLPYSLRTTIPWSAQAPKSELAITVDSLKYPNTVTLVSVIPIRSPVFKTLVDESIHVFEACTIIKIQSKAET